MADDVVVNLLVGIAGGLIGATGGVLVQHLENGAAARERREERLADAVQEFVTAATAWREWIRTGYSNRRLPVQKVLDVNNERSRERQAAYRRLQVHCSKDTFDWLKRAYEPCEYEVRKLAVGPLVEKLNDIIEDSGRPEAKETWVPRGSRPKLSPAGDAALDAFEKLVDEDLLGRCRSEIDALSRTERHFEGRAERAQDD